jgi:hypothetical protein
MTPQKAARRETIPISLVRELLGEFVAMCKRTEEEWNVNYTGAYYALEKKVLNPIKEFEEGG